MECGASQCSNEAVCNPFCIHYTRCIYMYVHCMCICISMYVCMYMYMYVCMNVCTNVCIYACMYVCMCTCMYVRKFVCMYVYMYILCTCVLCNKGIEYIEIQQQKNNPHWTEVMCTTYMYAYKSSKGVNRAQHNSNSSMGGFANTLRVSVDAQCVHKRCQLPFTFFRTPKDVCIQLYTDHPLLYVSTLYNMRRTAYLYLSIWKFATPTVNFLSETRLHFHSLSLRVCVCVHCITSPYMYMYVIEHYIMFIAQ